MRRSPRLPAAAAVGALLLLCVAAAAPVAAGAPAALAADGPVDQTDTAPDVTVHVDEPDGETVWLGQVVAVEGFAGGEAVVAERLARNREATADGDGALVLDSSDLEPGEWHLEGQESGASGVLNVTEQPLSASFDPEETDGHATLSVESPREDYEVRVSAVGHEGDPIPAEDLEYAALDDVTVRDGHLLLRGDAELELDTVFLTNGPNEFTVEVVDADATATANVTVWWGTPQAHLYVDDRPRRVGDVLEFHVNQSGPGPVTDVWIRVEHDWWSYRATVHVVEIEDYRAPVRLVWDTGELLGEHAGFSVASNARLGSVEVDAGFPDLSADYADVHHEFWLGVQDSEPIGHPMSMRETEPVAVVPARATDGAAGDRPRYRVEASAPESVAPGEDATLEVTATNEGDVSRVDGLDVWIDGSREAGETLDVDGGEAVHRSYDLDTDERGTVAWRVETAVDEANGTVVVEPGDAEDDEADDGDRATGQPANATVDGTGAEDGAEGTAGDEGGTDTAEDADDAEPAAANGSDPVDDATPGFGALAALVGLLCLAPAFARGGR